MNRPSTRCFLLLLVAGACFACGNGRESADESTDAAASVDIATGDAGRIDSLSARSGTDATDAAAELGEDPFAGFELEASPGATAESRRIALLLRNLDTRLAVVYADGGAGEVLLDSIAGGTDARIDITTRATSIALRSMAPDGDTLRAAEVTAGPDSVLEVIVGRPPVAP